MNELTLDEIDAFTKTMDPLLSLILTGGEPYIRHDLDQIARIFYENTKVPILTIPSNGWYLEKMDKQIKNMMTWCPELVLNQLISIDGLEEDQFVDAQGDVWQVAEYGDKSYMWEYR